MTNTPDSPLVPEPITTQAKVAHTNLEIQRRFRLAGDGVASKALQSAIWAFMQQRENNAT